MPAGPGKSLAQSGGQDTPRLQGALFTSTPWLSLQGNYPDLLASRQLSSATFSYTQKTAHEEGHLLSLDMLNIKALFPVTGHAKHKSLISALPRLVREPSPLHSLPMVLHLQTCHPLFHPFLVYPFSSFWCLLIPWLLYVSQALWTELNILVQDLRSTRHERNGERVLAN